MSKNVELREGFKQVCVWPGCIVGQENIEDFEKFMFDNFKVKVQYLEEIPTNPDLKNGIEVPDTGNRNDLFFAVHNSDVMKFAIPRLQFGIRWIEDALASYNNTRHLYPERVVEYKSWNADSDSSDE